MTKRLPPIHPGEILRTKFLEPLDLTQNQLALHLRVPATRINEIIHGRRAITAETALRLARYFGTSPDLWLGLQQQYDLETAQDAASKKIECEVSPRADAPG